MKLRPDEDDIQGMWNVFKYLIFGLVFTAVTAVFVANFVIPFIYRIL